MISKELLSEVLNDKVISIKKMDNKKFYKNIVMFECRENVFDNINIYELANKCKEWAIYEGYELNSSKPIVPNDEGKQVFNAWWMAWLFKMDGGYEAPQQVSRPSFIGEYEPEAIFKAAQWILEQKDKQ